MDPQTLTHAICKIGAAALQDLQRHDSGIGRLWRLHGRGQEQAQANLAPHSRISRLVIDRAYVDGASLYALHELGITFVVIAQVEHGRLHAVTLAEQAGTPIYERTETVRRQIATKATTEVWVSRVRMVADLRHWDAFGRRLRRSGPCVGRSAPSCTP